MFSTRCPVFLNIVSKFTQKITHPHVIPNLTFCGVYLFIYLFWKNTLSTLVNLINENGDQDALKSTMTQWFALMTESTIKVSWDCGKCPAYFVFWSHMTEKIRKVPISILWRNHSFESFLNESLFLFTKHSEWFIHKLDRFGSQVQLSDSVIWKHWLTVSYWWIVHFSRSKGYVFRSLGKLVIPYEAPLWFFGILLPIHYVLIEMTDTWNEWHL